MGNIYDCNQDHEEKRTECLPQREKKIKEIKKEIKRKIIKQVKNLQGLPVSENTKKFISFFKNVAQKIDCFVFPKAGKDFITAGYQYSFTNIEDIKQEIINENSKKDKVLFKKLKEDIMEQGEKSLFNVILQEFNQFYISLFFDKNEKIDTSMNNYTKSTIQNMEERSKIFEQENDYVYSRRKFIQLIQENRDIIKCIMISTCCLFSVLQSTIYQTYKEAIDKVSQYSDIDMYVKKSMFFQKLIQHYIYDQHYGIGQIIELSIKYYYQEPDQIIKDSNDNYSPEQHTFLDPQLYPEQGYTANIKTIDDEDDVTESCRFKQQICYRSSSNLDLMAMHQNIMNAVRQVEKENFPYKELFQILKTIFQEIKPYRIFLLIQNLSDSLVQVYLNSRPIDLENKYREMILAEDNKLSIILFLLHKFKETTQCDFNFLYNKLRFMMEFDEVLDPKIKYEIDQSLVRFFACLEMIVLAP